MSALQLLTSQIQGYYSRTGSAGAPGIFPFAFH
jgi:hypothetical protein